MLPVSLDHVVGAFWKTPGAFKIAVGVGLFGFAKRWWEQRRQRLLAEEGKRWPTYKGRVVAVQAIRRDGNDDRKGGWDGLLTYNYFVDETEIGEFRQTFRSEDEVDEWVRGLRGKTVTVAVDPKDKRRSTWIAEESAVAKITALRTVNATEPERLSTSVEFLRQIAFWAAVVGVCVAAWFESLEIAALYRNQTPPNQEISWWLAAFAIGSSLIAAYIFRKRFPGRSMEAVAEQFSDPAVRLFLKVLGLLESTVFIWYWLHWGGATVLGQFTSAAIFSALWAGVFAAAAVGLWVSGPRRQQHELASEDRFMAEH